MTKQVSAALPLFYSNPILLRSQEHASAGLRRSGDFRFAGSAVALPLVVGEFAQAGRHYPIVFSTDASAMPLAVTGVGQGKNLFVTEDGKWQANTYVPAYVRRYPFIGISADANGPIMLGIDGGSDRMVADVMGRDADAFFEVDGQAAPISKAAMNLCEAYAGEHIRTQAFADALNANGLLVEKEIQIRYTNPVQENAADDAAPHAQVNGFKLVDEEAFRKLPSAVLVDFHSKGWLDLIVLHLASQASWQHLVDVSAPAAVKAAA